MDIKPTFFSISGFLVPGIVQVSLIAWVVGMHTHGSISAAMTALPNLPSDNGLAILVSSLCIATLLASTFVIGAILSELFTFVARQLIIRPLLRQKLRDNVERLFSHDTLEKLIRLDMDARESFVYMHTSGLDLNWYAGRVRMLGGTGFALFFAGCVGIAVGGHCGHILALFVVATLALGVAIYRSNKFDAYIAAAAAVLIRQDRDFESAMKHDNGAGE